MEVIRFIFSIDAIFSNKPFSIRHRNKLTKWQRKHSNLLKLLITSIKIVEIFSYSHKWYKKTYGWQFFLRQRPIYLSFLISFTHWTKRFVPFFYVKQYRNFNTVRKLCCIFHVQRVNSKTVAKAFKLNIR